ncbi:uncharacterized protein [Nicotiana tomentosiformis]|uniref:uncharacterized protein n=1 Tax=Nicotiana tomentosiformis TaxID=4098 RepID=UPI00388C72CA
MSVSSLPSIDISRIQAYTPGVKERKQKKKADREHDRGQSKRARSSGPSGKANVVADALSRRSMGSLSYLQPQKSEITCEIHQLANLGVQLLDLGGTRVTIQETATSSLVTEVKECQYEDPILAHYRDTTPQKEKIPLEITRDGVLRYRGRLCVPNIAGLRQQVMGEAHYSRYSIHPGATKMYHDSRGI